MSTTNPQTTDKLRICVVSNYYPPFSIGGYELGCSDIVEALKRRGHQVKVLTSTYSLAAPQEDGSVYRWLKLLDWWSPDSFRSMSEVLKKEIGNQRAFKKLCREFNPHVVYMWNPVNISLSLVSVAQRLGLPVTYFVSDHWVEDWESDLGYRIWREYPTRLHRRLFWKALLASLRLSGILRPPAPPDFRHTHFVSEHLKQQALNKGKPVTQASVVHWGVDVKRFHGAERSKHLKRLLYVGQFAEHKGVHTAVEALKVLVRNGHESTTLTIAGSSAAQQYQTRIREMVSSWGLEEHVQFTGHLSRDQVASVYAEHDVLIFPSVWDEPFSITVLEAMASGLAVVGTATGGSSEILRDGINALVFPKEDAESCARCVARLFDDPKLFDEISRNGRRTIEQKYRIEQMVDTIENSLTKFAFSSAARKDERVPLAATSAQP